MKYYHSYMDRQEISPERHQKLVDLEKPRKTPSRAWTRYGALAAWARYGALAACAVLILGAGAWALSANPGAQTDVGPHDTAPAPAAAQTEKPGPLQPDDAQAQAADGCDVAPTFVVHSWVPDDPMSFYVMPAINYQDVSYPPEVSASRAFAPGSFVVDLTLEDVQKLFWGPDGVPEACQTGTGRQDLPWALFWDGYALNGYAWYDGQGQFTELTIHGVKGESIFTLELRLGALPFSCLAFPDREASDVFGTPVTGWSWVHEVYRGQPPVYACGSEFMTGNNIGVRFENQNCGIDTEDRMSGERWFNALFVRQVLTGDGGLHLDHLMTYDDIPAWRDAAFDSLDQARQEADFAPYLPVAEPKGYNAYTGNKNFFARLSYQEGQQNMLFVRWSRGYDDVEVCVRFPEGDWSDSYEPVDINLPESYDTRLYAIPWWDTVPEEYRAGFYDVTFRAEDMTLAVVEARQIPRDTGGEGFRFNVLHPSGVVVSYYCNGVTAQEVWEMVENTL